MKKIILAICTIALLAACHKDDNKEEETIDRTVVVYMSGECSLYDYVMSDLNEIKTGSKTIGDNNALVVYVDRGNVSELPWLARIKDGVVVDSVSVADMNITGTDGYPGAAVGEKYDPYASDPKVMESILRYAYNKYPSKNADYGLVLWGHGSGWLIKDSIPYTAMARKKAYGIDNGKNGRDDTGRWLNLPTMAKMLSKLPHLSFIFCDCCNMMCLENAYELRHVTDYLIGSPAEIPGVGAPYHTVVPALFERTTFWKSIVDRYYEQRAGGFDEPLSVIKTSEMENLANATKVVLKSIATKIEDKYPDMSNLIYYYYSNTAYPEFYDANDFVLKYAEPGDYNSWKLALDKAVIYKKMATSWMIDKDYGDFTYYWNKYYGYFFTVTEEKYGGVSMFVPTYYQQMTDNVNIQQMQWYTAAGYDLIGW